MEHTPRRAKGPHTDLQVMFSGYGGEDEGTKDENEEEGAKHAL